MRRMRFLIALSFASVLAPVPAVAQSPGPDYAPIELTADDLGTWDVQLTARSPIGGVMTVRGTETNTIGCDGRCIVTKAGGQLRSATMRRGSSAPWWRDADAARSDPSLKQTGLRQTEVPATSPVTVESPALPTRPLAPRTMERSNGMRTIRASIEYPDANRRIVTTYAIAPDGQQTQTARIVYTRRK